MGLIAPLEYLPSWYSLMKLSEITHGAPQGKYDNVVLSFRFHCYVDFTKKKDHRVFERGNYMSMRDSESVKTCRDKFLKLSNETDTNVEAMWSSLKLELHHLTKLFVQLVSASNKPTWKDKGSIPNRQQNKTSNQGEREKPSPVDA